MNGFFHFFLSAVNPMMNVGFSGALPELMTSAHPAWWLIIYMFVIGTLPPIVVWIFYLLKPSSVCPLLPVRPGQVAPLVSVVIAGRNESASIGQCIRGALTCGYPNIEVIFVDDNSQDDSVAIARRAALSVTRSRADAQRVRIFPSPRRNGKASSLNIGIRMARGEFIAITDADSVIQYGSMQHWLLPFRDPRVGGVAGNIRVLNSTDGWITRFQELEYAMRFTLSKFVLARLNLVPVISGMGGLFRGEILRRLHGFDTGLGDDTDLTQMLRKQCWKLSFSFGAVVFTTVPNTRDHLWRQRMRWSRNAIKIRVSKHREFFALGRFGFANAIVTIRLVTGRTLTQWIVGVAAFIAIAENGPLNVPQLISTVYWISILFIVVRLLIARDIAGTPQPLNFLLIPLYPFYLLSWTGPVMYAELCEVLRLGAKHPYVPDHVWEEIPWW
jgi:biofilm PGA synthesis N-glycosyltransferase PgaC